MTKPQRSRLVDLFAIWPAASTLLLLGRAGYGFYVRYTVAFVVYFFFIFALSGSKIGGTTRPPVAEPTHKGENTGATVLLPRADARLPGTHRSAARERPHHPTDDRHRFVWLEARGRPEPEAEGRWCDRQ